jgi:ATP phosphoribosyltransferase regulatory subunit
LESLIAVDVQTITLDLGHVGIYSALTDSLNISESQEAELFALLQTKDQSEIQQWIKTNIDSEEAGEWLLALTTLSGDISILEKAQDALSDAPAEAQAAIDELTAIANVVAARYPNVNFYFDLSELRGYHYHTGTVFAAYAEGYGDAIANGGRYDHIGEAFGRSRPATGFGLNLTSVMRLAEVSLSVETLGIYAPASEDPQQWLAIQALRQSGERVVSGLSSAEDNLNELHCDRQLTWVDGAYQVQPLTTKV